jgi:hypothetical protein
MNVRKERVEKEFEKLFGRPKSAWTTAENSQVGALFAEWGTAALADEPAAIKKINAAWDISKKYQESALYDPNTSEETKQYLSPTNTIARVTVEMLKDPFLGHHFQLTPEGTYYSMMARRQFDRTLNERNILSVVEGPVGKIASDLEQLYSSVQRAGLAIGRQAKLLGTRGENFTPESPDRMRFAHKWGIIGSIVDWGLRITDVFLYKWMPRSSSNRESTKIKSYAGSQVVTRTNSGTLQGATQYLASNHNPELQRTLRDDGRAALERAYNADPAGGIRDNRIHAEAPHLDQLGADLMGNKGYPVSTTYSRDHIEAARSNLLAALYREQLAATR